MVATDWVSALLEGGWMMDVVLGFVVVEAGVLAWWLRRRGDTQGRAARAVARLLLPGVCLMVALRLALTDASGLWIGAWLLLALAAHVWDLRDRLGGRRGL